MEKVPYGSYGYESESVLRNEHPNAVRIDDKEIWDGYVYAWIDEGILYWWTNANTVYMPEDCSGFFQGNTNLQYFSFKGFDMSLVTTTKNMFAGATALQEIELSNSFNATSLVNVNGMFKNTPSLTILDEEASLQTGTLTDVTSMFAGCGLPRPVCRNIVPAQQRETAQRFADPGSDSDRGKAGRPSDLR